MFNERNVDVHNEERQGEKAHEFRSRIVAQEQIQGTTRGSCCSV